MILGLRTAIYHVSDLAKAKAWYSEVLGEQPYFDQPFYVGYSVGGFELGLLPDGKSGAGGTVAYWGVADAAEAVARLEALGAGRGKAAGCGRRNSRSDGCRSVWQFAGDY